jgi:CRP-like cAMP-binding protein
MELLIKNIRKYITLSDDEANEISTYFEKNKISKKVTLLEKGDVSNFTLFVSSGCLKMYSLDENSVEHIIQFASEDWWISDLYSFLTGNPSEYYIESIKDTTFLKLTKENREKMLEEHPKMERFFRIICEYNIVHSRKRIVDLMQTPAKERYEKFCNMYPSILNDVPLKHIASYIGVTPEFLSKLRSIR